MTPDPPEAGLVAIAVLLILDKLGLRPFVWLSKPFRGRWHIRIERAVEPEEEERLHADAWREPPPRTIVLRPGRWMDPR